MGYGEASEDLSEQLGWCNDNGSAGEKGRVQRVCVAMVSPGEGKSWRSLSLSGDGVGRRAEGSVCGAREKAMLEECIWSVGVRAALSQRLRGCGEVVIVGAAKPGAKKAMKTRVGLAKPIVVEGLQCW